MSYQQITSKNNSTDKLYVNSYTMSRQGSTDVSFNIDLGRLYTANAIQLDYAAIDTLFSTFYPSQFSDFTKFLYTIVDGGEEETLVCNQYINSLTSFADWFTATNNNNLVMVASAVSSF